MPQDYPGGWERAYENMREDEKCGDQADSHDELHPKTCNCECHARFGWYPITSEYYWDYDIQKLRRIIGPIQQVWKGNPYCCMDCNPPSPLDFY